MNKVTALSIISVLMVGQFTSSHVSAADPANGQLLARQCSVCHGKIGVANDPEVPNLAGQSAFYIEKSLKEYRSGGRQDRRMSLIAQNIVDSDIKDLAAWYASFVVKVTAPE
ncbi:MAG: cytochrome c553 [Candidatus Azotimanducaceae bacterium]|jgi:cytochrome c553